MANETVEISTIHYLYFWMSGLSSLFVWNCMLSLSDYFEDRFSPEATRIYPFFFNVGGFMSFFLYDRIRAHIEFKRVSIVFPIFLVSVFILIYLIGEYGGPRSGFKFNILLALIFLSGFINNIFQVSKIQYSFKFTYLEITYFNTGTGLAGIIANLIALTNASLLEQTAFATKGLVYLVFQVLIIGTILFIFGKYFATNPPEISDQEAVDASTEVDSVKGSIAAAEEPLANPSIADTFGRILPCYCNMTLTFAISLGLHPAINFALGLGMQNISMQIQIILLIFNLGDSIGKYSYGVFPLKDGWTPYIISMSRFMFVVIAIWIFMPEGEYPTMSGKPLLSVPFNFLLALSNGFMTSALFSLSSERVPNSHKKNSGFLMTQGLLLGVSYGALCVLLGTQYV